MRFLFCCFLTILSTSYLLAQHEGDITLKSRVHKSNQIYAGLGFASPQGTEEYFGGLYGEIGYQKHITPILSLGSVASFYNIGTDSGAFFIATIGADVRVNFISDSKKKNWQGYLSLRPLFGIANHATGTISNQNFGGLMIGPGIEYSHPNTKVSFYANAKYQTTSKLELRKDRSNKNDKFEIETKALKILLFTVGVMYKF